ncbi:MAG: C39 family peptidase [Oscillospiraceae bacterium]|nr:C39 family peptidase [Oscillospiraceae bacterium]
MKKKKWLGAVFTLLILAVIAALSAPKVVKFYRDVSFYWQDRSETELKVKQYADEMGIAYSEYPESLIELLERNPETEEFVLNYPFRQEAELTALDCDLSEGVPLFMQWDQRWGYIKYGSDVVGITGCGPVCLSMAGYYVTGGDEAFRPEKIIEFSAENGYYESGYGTSWTLISEGGVKLGLDVTEIPLVKQRIVDNLEAGNPIICSMRAGDFTTTGHYIVLVGWEDGMIRVNDPNSHANSEALWSYEQIEGQIRNLWVIRPGQTG